MWEVLLFGVAIAITLNLIAAPLRERVTLVHSQERLVLRNQQAALRLDGTICVLCLLGLLYALATRSITLIVAMGSAAAFVGWQVVCARRAPAFVFDRPTNLVKRGLEPICNLSAVEGLELVPRGETSTLELRYRDSRGELNRQLLHRARPKQAAALQSAIGDFLGGGSERSR